MPNFASTPANEGLTVAREFVESRTAKTPGRPIFNDMLQRIENGEAAGLLAWHPDRLARNWTDGGHVINLLDTDQLTELRFPTFWFEDTPRASAVSWLCQMRRVRRGHHG
ncbi:MAG: recombinase family protein [Kiritimatiellae bacterium]|nr:recombinase family protein [Kiritimatiellia bacterium]